MSLSHAGLRPDRSTELDPLDLRSHLGRADPAILLAVLVQLTGDASLLDSYAHEISHAPNPPEMAGRAEPHVVAELADRVVEAVSRERVDPAVDPELFARLAPLVLGTPVGDEYLPMLLEQGGFRAAQPVLPRVSPVPDTMTVAIVGAGLAGIAAGIAASTAGIAYEIFDRGADLGGTWHTQTYPGVAVDTPAAYYSYSFELNPEWTNYYPKGGEYCDYLRAVADKYGVREHIRFRTEVEAMAWDDATGRWELTLRGADGARSRTHARAVITAAGYLNRPQYPQVPGRTTFAGASMHSGEWDAGAELAGKRVAVVGTGCTAAQIVDAVADDVAHLTLVQRQPHWVGRRKREDDSVPEDRRWLLRHVPYYAQWCRTKAFWGASDNIYPVVLADPDWAATHQSISPANDVLLQDCLAYIEETFGAGSELAAKLTPDFAPFGKRIIRDPGGYYQALTRPHVDVVTSPVERIENDGIRTADGELVPVDVIVYATGFTLDFLSTMEIRGRDGVLLTDEWAGNDPRAYRGGTVPGFPNLFVTSAPNAGQGHGAGNNFGIETFVHYIMECLQLLMHKGATCLEPTRDAYDGYTARIDEAMEHTVWRRTPTAHTYYRNETGRVIVPCPWRLVDFWADHRVPVESDFLIR